MKIDRVCQYCGINFEADHWQVNRNRAKFCSVKCKTNNQIDAGYYGNFKKRKKKAN